MPTGTVTTYNLNVGIQLDIEDLIAILDPYDVPLLGTSGADGRSALAQGTVFEKKYEWLDESLLVGRSTNAVNVVTADTVLTVATGDQTKFTTGDVLLIDSEYVRVTGYGTTADTLLITKGYGSSTSTTHTTTSVILTTGTALVEGSDPSSARAVDRTDRFNYTQIFGPHAVTVSASENVVRKYGLGGTTEFDHQVANRMKEAAVSIEQALLYGVRNEDTSNGWRTFGGINWHISQGPAGNTDSSTTTLTEAALLALLQTVYDNGGQADRFVVGSTQKRTASAFASGSIRYDRADDGRGYVVDYYDSDFGRISIILDRWARKTEGFLFSRDQAEIATLRPMVFEPLAKTGDSIKGQIVAEKGLKFRRMKHAARFTALT